MTYFHGGYGQLKVGDLVLPPAETKAPSLASFGAHSVCDRSKVYVCSIQEGALLYACMHHSGRGKIYEVEPIGDLQEDPDAKFTGFSFSCDRARVIRVIRVKGKTIKKIQKHMLEAA
jgi:hypothetical protein